jgi:hypothetical protein
MRNAFLITSLALTIMLMAATENKVASAIEYIDNQHLVYDDVTDDNITEAILTANDLFNLSDDELQSVVDNYAD